MYDLHGTDAGILGAIIGGAASLFGGGMADKRRRQEAVRGREFSAAEAGKQRMFQERMRSTAWQASVRDMEAAGLNPALAYSQGPAASPGGAMGSSGIARQEDVVTPAVSSAMQMKRMSADLRAIHAGVDKTKAETEVLRGRPGRVLEPIVDRGVKVAEGTMRLAESVLSAKNRSILQYEIGSSARSIRDAISKTIGAIRRQMVSGPIQRRGTPRIGPNVTRRRR